MSRLNKMYDGDHTYLGFDLRFRAENVCIILMELQQQHELHHDSFNKKTHLSHANQTTKRTRHLVAMQRGKVSKSKRQHAVALGRVAVDQAMRRTVHWLERARLGLIWFRSVICMRPIARVAVTSLRGTRLKGIIRVREKLKS